MDHEFRKRLRGVHARMQSRFDQQLQEFKLAYNEFTEADKTAFKEVLSEAILAMNKLTDLSGGMRMSLKLQVSHRRFDDHGETVYDGFGMLSPVVLQAAVEAWDNNEEYAPHGIGVS